MAKAATDAEKEKGKHEAPAERPSRVKQVVRLVETNLDGDKPIGEAIRSIRGISFMFSNAVAVKSGFGRRRLVELSEPELKKLEEIILNPENFGIPSWMFNQRRDIETLEDKHMLASRLELKTKIDINRLKKIRSYRGVRHVLGLPVRGQRTRSSFRKGRVVGVKRTARTKTKK